MPLVKWAAGMDLKELLYCYFKSENNNIFKKKLRFWAKFDGNPYILQKIITD